MNPMEEALAKVRENVGLMNGEEPQEVDAVEAVDVEDAVEVEDVVEVEETADDGYLDYQAYIDSGRDPEHYRGRAAYEKDKETYANMKELKEIKRQTEAAALQIQQMAESQQQEQERKHLAQVSYLQRQLEEAKDSLEVDKALAIQKKLEGMSQPQQGEPEAVKMARKLHPKIDFDSPDFDPILNTKVQDLVNKVGDEEQRRLGRPLATDEIQRIIGAAYSELAPKKEPKKRPAEASRPAPSPAAAKLDDSLKDSAEMMRRWKKTGDPEKVRAAEFFEKQHGIKL